MNRKDELQQIIDTARSEMDAIIGADQEKENAIFVGRFFKVRNSYSMPKKKSDYWFLYTYVVGVKKGSLIVRTFQKDSIGNVRIETDWSMPAHLKDHHEEIPKGEYLKAWDALYVSLREMENV